MPWCYQRAQPQHTYVAMSLAWVVNPRPFLADLGACMRLSPFSSSARVSSAPRTTHAAPPPLAVGKSCAVKLKWGMEYRGTLVATDAYMNLQLSGADEWIDGAHAGTLGVRRARAPLPPPPPPPARPCSRPRLARLLSSRRKSSSVATTCCTFGPTRQVPPPPPPPLRRRWWRREKATRGQRRMRMSAFRRCAGPAGALCAAL